MSYQEAIEKYVEQNPLPEGSKEDKLWYKDDIPEKELQAAQKKYADNFDSSQETPLILWQDHALGMYPTAFLITDKNLYYKVIRKVTRGSKTGVIPLPDIGSISFERGFSAEFAGEFKINNEIIGEMVGGKKYVEYLNSFFQSILWNEGTSTSESSSDTEQASSSGQPDQQTIAERLKKYSEHIKSDCINCGYSGKMGVQKKKVFFLFSLPVILIALFAGFVPGLILLILRVMTKKHKLKCPQCNYVQVG